ncbi:PhzF family phenazine biosynthesis isomerase [Pseudooceanicola sp. GBMRC 2024]|uniref:PhzF family phenazine biosynthesis isomerase n=2 Tax=Paracoccaceae TaxID=31989 RepID=A0A6L7G9I1_9RHOB|nr:PhzF family phenazine biosynthesis isomerase [Pseudooceanicola albus]
MFQVDAFSAELFSGNPAGVLILDDWLDEKVMQSIAMENNLAETAFARPAAEGSGWDLRWFTPQTEVDFCGHATLATAHVLTTEYGASGTLAFQTLAGTLRVTATDAGYELDLPVRPPQPMPDPLPAHWAEALSDLPEGTPLWQSPGNLFAELPDAAAILAFRPNLPKLRLLAPMGLVITAPGASIDFVSRYFVPGSGIDEDPVTGSTHATLVPLWAERLGRTRLSAAQLSRRGGQIACRLEGDRVYLEGQAITYMDAMLRIMPT